MNISKDTQIVLNAINSINPDVQDRFYSVDSIHNAVKSERIPRYEDTFAILCSAANAQLIEFADAQRTCIRRLELCRSYRQIRRSNYLRWLLNSVFVPVIVSIITAFLTSISFPEISSHLRELLEKFLSLLR